MQERLQQYYHTRAALHPDEVLRAQSLAVDICSEIQGFLHSRVPDMPLGEMSLGGSLLDDLQVRSLPLSWLISPLSFRRCRMGNTRASFRVCSGGQCGPCLSAGAPTAGSHSVAPHPRRGDAAHTPAALDDPTSQSGIFPQRTQLLGQVMIL